MSDVLKSTDTHVHTHEHQNDIGANTIFGFWSYLMTDLVLFACLFATFSVLRNATAGGPTAYELFDLKFVLIETFILLFSSITYGFSMIGLHGRKKKVVLCWLVVTFLLGTAFTSMEIYEFHHLIKEGAGPSRSAFLSSFFALVGTHGLHVASGLLWLLALIYQINKKGLTATNSIRLNCMSLFWHFLDVIWIAVFTIVYLMGVM
ncbi:cytochrome o ubiquinol oxidase subunit III [Candidatus Pandoraea novymonadis]|uniref:Cytochrome bo(3) ubiquinol oxidase subunit 3 n=1 Tax=Candidatus Pandoraea novymonadis TaxID=1808959 RepID=A0ABX5FEI1_9BURK|nr:cytochrome o ubiquinol oxidase subunit III [Candidatus Pandoraea novymonadis]PSB92105.1 Cytochrome bo(3) ubiquinol oxidase subunit 3 [Candidatus Pandoraea novymonadis]